MILEVFNNKNEKARIDDNRLKEFNEMGYFLKDQKKENKISNKNEINIKNEDIEKDEEIKIKSKSKSKKKNK